MSKKVKNSTLRNENGVPLKETTTVFKTEEYDDAAKYASHKRSYVGMCYEEGELAGFYVPA